METYLSATPELRVVRSKFVALVIKHEDGLAKIESFQSTLAQIKAWNVEDEGKDQGVVEMDLREQIAQLMATVRQQQSSIAVFKQQRSKWSRFCAKDNSFKS